MSAREGALEGGAREPGALEGGAREPGAHEGGARQPRRWITRTPAQTERLGAELAAELGPDGLLLLTGELGSGKTVLARGLAGALGIDPRQVLSPTFNLIREHRGGARRLVHVDLYRLAPEEVSGLGLDELLAGPGVKVVEWAERLPAPLRPATALAPLVPLAPLAPLAPLVPLAALAPLAPMAPTSPATPSAQAPVLALRLRRLPEAGGEAREIVEIAADGQLEGDGGGDR